MTSKPSTKVRLVRCPRCRLLLPELPGVSLYRCGGCSTVLQAKNRKNETKNTRSSLHESDGAQKNESEQASEEKEPLSAIQKASVPSNDVSSSTGLKDETKDLCSRLLEIDAAQKNESEQGSEEKEAISTIQKASVPSTGDSALDQSRRTEQKELRNCNSPSSDVTSSTGLKDETKDIHLRLHETYAAQKTESEQVSEEKEEDVSAIQKASVPSTGDSALDQSHGTEHKELGNCRSPSPGLKDETKDLCSRLHEIDAAQKNESEQVSEEKEAISTIQKASVPSTGDFALDQSRRTEQKELGNCNGPSNDVTSSTGLKDETKDIHLRLHETYAAQKNELEQVSEEKEAVGAIQKASVPSTGDSALYQSRGAEQKELGNCSSPSDDVTSSTGLKDETKDTRSRLHETDGAQKNELEQVSEEKEPLSAIQKASVPSTGDSALDQSCGMEQKEFGNCNSHSNDVTSSTGLKHETKDVCSRLHETDGAQKNESEQVSEEIEPLSAIQKVSVPYTGDSALDQSCGMEQKEFGCNSPSNDVTSSTGLIDETKDIRSRLQETDAAQKNESEQVSEEKEAVSTIQKAFVPSTENSALDQSCGTELKQLENCNRPSNDVSSSAGLTSHENEEPSLEAETHIELDEEHSLDQNKGRDPDLSGLASALTQLNCQENDDTSSVAEADIEVDETKYSLQQKNGRNQNESGDPNVELLENMNVSKEISSSTELTCHENEKTEYDEGLNSSSEISSSTKLNCQENDDTSSVSEAVIEVDETKYSLKQKNGRNQNESGESNVELLENMNVSKEISSSTDLTCHENEETNYDEALNFSGEISSSTKLNCQENDETSLVTGAHIEADESIYSLDPKDGKNQNEFGDHYRKWSEASSSTELTCHENEEMNENKSGDFNGEQRGVLSFSGEVPSSTELNCRESEESFEVGENKHFLEQKNGRYQNEFRDFNKESPSIASVSNEVSSSTELTCQSCHEIEEPSPEAREEENFNTHIFKSSSEKIFMVTRQRESISSDNLTSSPNEQMEQSQKIVHRGFGRVSSVDTLENTQVSPSMELNNERLKFYRSPTARSYYGYGGSVSSYDGIEDQFLDRHQNVSFLNTKGIPKRGEYMINRDSEMKHHTRYSSSVSSEKKHYAVKGSKLEREECPGPTRHHDPMRNRMGLETDAYVSTLPFYLRDSRAGYGIGSPSSSNSHSPDKTKYLEKEKMELLRMVYDLQNQLNRLQISKESGNGTYPSGATRKEREIPSYYGHIASEEEDIYHDPNNPRYLRQTSRMPFSGNVTNNGHQSEYSCFHGSQDWHYSSHLPPHDVCCSTGHKCQNPHLLSHSSPERFSSSQFSSRSCDTKSGDQRHKNHEKGSYLRERNYLKRRHFRPIAGGAPFVACYNCSKLLQMPADFLLFRRKFHRLTCSACSTVLKFSLNRSHLVPYTPGDVAPLCTDIDHISNANDLPYTDQVSCSDDYDQSYRRSYSTEGEASSLTPPERKFDDRKRSSGSSFEVREYRKGMSVLRVSENKYKSHVENFESAGSSEIKELPPRTGSPLHRLMGYSSPSQVIKW